MGPGGSEPGVCGEAVRAVKVGFALVLLAFSQAVALAQASTPVRDDWRHMSESLNHCKLLEYSLQEAPLSMGERDRIYKTLLKDLRQSFIDRKEEHETVLRAPVGLISLATTCLLPDGFRAVPLSISGAGLPMNQQTVTISHLERTRMRNRRSRPALDGDLTARLRQLSSAVMPTAGRSL